MNRIKGYIDQIRRPISLAGAGVLALKAVLCASGVCWIGVVVLGLAALWPKRLKELEKSKQSPIACNMGMMDSERRKRHKSIMQTLRESAQEKRKLADGLAIKFHPEHSLLLMLAEFVSWERLCCPFYTFVLEAEPDGGPVWLRITGRKGVKEFLIKSFA